MQIYIKPIISGGVTDGLSAEIKLINRQKYSQNGVISMAKRGSNIYKRKDGRFEGRVHVGYKADGSKKYKSVYGSTLSEVKDKMSQLYSLRTEKAALTIKLTVHEAAEEWLSSARLRVKESSYANYENILNKHILPILGGEYISALSASRINEFIHFKMTSGRLNGKGGLSAKTVRDILTVYHSIERYVYREYGIRESNFTMPKTERKCTDVLSREERQQLESFLINNMCLTNLAVLLCMFTGLRIGELCGLKWSNIDFIKGTLSVERTVQRINKNGSSQVVIGTPKSRSSVRTVPIPEFLMTLLEKYKGYDNLYIITNSAKPMEPRTMQNRFKSILKSCGVRNVNFHLLRHTYATVCIEKGFDPKALSEILGHADAAITLNRYVHSSMDAKKEYVSRLSLSA